MPGWAKLILVLLPLGVLYWPGVQHHWQLAHDSYFVPFDAVQYIPAFFKFDANDSVPTTYLKEYFLNAICPPLYKASLVVGAQFADVRHFQLAMMYAAYALFVAILGRLGWLLGGAVLSFAVMAFTISAWIFIGLGFIGGAPRMHGYPLMAVIIYALARDRPKILGLTAILGALLYPVVAIIAGLCLTGWLLLPNYAKHGVVSQWPIRRRLATLALTGFLTLTALVPLYLSGSAYGQRIVNSDIVNYPEAGADGNYRPYDQLPYKLFGVELFTYFLGPMYGQGDPIVSWFNVHAKLDRVTLLYVLALTGVIVLVVILRGLNLVMQKDPGGGGIRIISFFVVCAVLHVIAWLAAPYLYIPTRYFMFSLPFLIVLIFPWSLYLLLGRVSRLQSSPRLRDFVFVGIISVYLMAFGGRGNVQFSAPFVEKTARPLFDLIATLPRDSLIAGWPLGQLRQMEYVTRRNVFLTGDLHQVLHRNFVHAMRARMDALFEAYFSTDAAPLYRLRREFGVTHLLVETQHFTDPTRPPDYYAPWKARIVPRLAEIKGKEYLMNGSLHQKGAVFNQNGFVLLELAKLP